jgi:hypothetical protein
LRNEDKFRYNEGPTYKDHSISKITGKYIPKIVIEIPILPICSSYHNLLWYDRSFK